MQIGTFGGAGAATRKPCGSGKAQPRASRAQAVWDWRSRAQAERVGRGAAAHKLYTAKCPRTHGAEAYKRGLAKQKHC
ncbi:hypothetical protein D7W09_06985 [bacterium D16-34]|nr:hypothetical protein D7W09_06985 [bacterium D16-34]